MRGRVNEGRRYEDYFGIMGHLNIERIFKLFD